MTFFDLKPYPWCPKRPVPIRENHNSMAALDLHIAQEPQRGFIQEIKDMGLLDKVKSLSADVANNGKWTEDLSQTIRSSLVPLLESAKEHIKEDVAYLKYIATPLFKALPLPVQLIGRERLRWDAILLDIRNEIVLPAGGNIKPDAQTAKQIAEIVKRHHSAK